MPERIGEDPPARPDEVVAEPPAHRKPDDRVEPPALHLRGPAERLLREEPLAIEQPAAREHRVHPGERACGENAVHRGDLGVEEAVGEVHLPAPMREERLLGEAGVEPEQAAEHAHRPAAQPRPERRRLERRFDQSGQAPARFFGCAEERPVEPERLDEERAHRFLQARLRHAANELANEPAVGDAVVPGHPLPRGLRGRERARHVVPVEDPLGVVDEAPDRVEPGLVAQDLPHRHRRFARLRELGPVLGDGVVVVHEPAVDEGMNHRGHHPLGRGERQRDCVRLPVDARALRPRPDVDDALAAVVDADRRAPRAAPAELQLKLLGHRAEVFLNESLNHDFHGV